MQGPGHSPFPTGRPQGTLIASPHILYSPAFYPEGPLWDAGRLYFVEYARHTVRALDTDHREPRTIWQQPGFGPAAVAVAADGALWVTGSDSNCLARIDPDGSTRTTVQHDASGNPFPAPNDLVFDRHGGIYFTASGSFDRNAPPAGAVFHHQPDGDTRSLATDIHYANGIALCADGSTLFVTEHLRNRILAFDVGPDRCLRRRRIHTDLSTLAPTDLEDPLLGPDGIACSRSGSLIVAHFGTGRLLVIGPDARLEGIITLPCRYPTNVAFGETERKLYVTAFHDNIAPFAGAVFEVVLHHQLQSEQSPIEARTPK